MRLAVIGGDGIGPEVVAKGLEVLDAVLPGVERTDYDLGAAAYHRTGEALPTSVLTELDGHDAILLGAVGDPSVPPGVLERGLLLRLRFALDHHINLRPVRLFPGVVSPVGDKAIDMVVVREGTEGPYVGNGGRLREGTPHEVATETSLNTAYGVERVVRDAFCRARLRERKHLTLVHKTNVLVHAGGLWRRVFDDVATEFTDVTTEYQHVDAAAMYFVTQPERFDVVVTDNLFGDILTDIGAAIGGGIGLAASGNIDATRVHPSMFEPVHGSAPDIAGQGRADPTAAVLSVALLLEHLGHLGPARRVEATVAADLAGRGGAVRSTSQIGAALLAGLG
ncbi:MAG: 3-isopropylmalate dehydrogenase [Mycobacteriales bacterium]